MLVPSACQPAPGDVTHANVAQAKRTPSPGRSPHGGSVPSCAGSERALRTRQPLQMTRERDQQPCRAAWPSRVSDSTPITRTCVPAARSITAMARRGDRTRRRSGSRCPAVSVWPNSSAVDRQAGVPRTGRSGGAAMTNPPTGLLALNRQGGTRRTGVPITLSDYGWSAVITRDPPFGASCSCCSCCSLIARAAQNGSTAARAEGGGCARAKNRLPGHRWRARLAA